MTFNKKFYEKYGWKITDDAIHTAQDSVVEDIATKYYYKVQHKHLVTQATINELEALVGTYPDYLPIKNHLYISYRYTNQDDKALAFLKETVAQYPHYVFAQLNLANIYTAEKNYNKAAEILGEPYNLSNVCTDDIIHQSAFFGYYRSAIELELGRNNPKKARDLHEVIFDYDRKHDQVEELGLKIMVGLLSGPSHNHAPHECVVESIPQPLSGVYLQDAKGLPVFNHREIKALYFNNLDNIPNKTVKDMLALPRTTLIKDLEHAAADMVLRFEQYQKLELDEITQSFGIHALFLLTELRSVESLPLVLEILKQNDDFNSFWFGDYTETYFYPALYFLGQNQLELLKEFVKTEHLLCWNRCNVATAVTQVALHQPERRAEVLAWFKDVIEYHLAHAQNTGLIDSRFFEIMIGDLCDLRAIELEKEIAALFAAGWVADGACGPIDEVKKQLALPPDPYSLSPLPNNIFELYKGDYQDRRAKSNNPDAQEGADALLNPNSHDSYFTDLMMRQLLEHEKKQNNWQPEPQPTVKRVEPKVGRNDPCPCGSGKKYKKCHGA